MLSCLPVGRVGGYPLGLPALHSLVSLGRKQERAKQVFLALKTHTSQHSHQLDWCLLGQSWNTESQTSEQLRNMRGHPIHPPASAPCSRKWLKNTGSGWADLTSLLNMCAVCPGASYLTCEPGLPISAGRIISPAL